MKYRQLGRTGLQISEFTLGSNTFGGASHAVWATLGGLGEKEVAGLVQQAFEAGVNSFDTADVYGAGESEVLLGRALASLGVPRSAYLVTTKVGLRVGRGANDVGLSRAHILAAAEQSLRRLGIEHIDIYMIHGFDPHTPFEESLAALELLQRDGKVRYVGCSNLAAWQIMKALGLASCGGLPRFDVIEIQYSAGTREVEREILPLAEDQQLGVIAWAPLANGILAGKHERNATVTSGTRMAGGAFTRHERPDERNRLFDVLEVMRPIAERHQVPVARVALSWLLAQPSVTSLAIGVTRSEQLADNIAASSLALDTEELAMIGAAGVLPEEYPGWMMTRNYLGRTQ